MLLLQADGVTCSHPRAQCQRQRDAAAVRTTAGTITRAPAGTSGGRAQAEAERARRCAGQAVAAAATSSTGQAAPCPLRRRSRSLDPGPGRQGPSDRWRQGAEAIASTAGLGACIDKPSSWRPDSTARQHRGIHKRRLRRVINREPSSTGGGGAAVHMRPQLLPRVRGLPRLRLVEALAPSTREVASREIPLLVPVGDDLDYAKPSRGP